MYNYTTEEREYIFNRLTSWGEDAIAKHLDRSVRSVQKQKVKYHQHALNQELVPSGVASQVTGYTPQGLTKMAREGRLKARRKPKSKWWLFYPPELENLKKKGTVET